MAIFNKVHLFGRSLSQAEITDAAIDHASTPFAWRHQSDTLWRATRVLLRGHREDVRRGRAGTSTIDTNDVRLSAILFRRRQVVPPASLAPACMMLAGLSLEALVKGVWVTQDPTRIDTSTGGTKLVYPWGAQHLSLRLFAGIGWKLSVEEADVIDRVAMFVRWAGRYPVPMLAAELSPMVGEPERGAYWRSDDFQVIDDLRVKLRERLTSGAS